MEPTKAEIQKLASELGKLSAQAGDDYDLVEGLSNGYAEGAGDFGQGAAELDRLVSLTGLQSAVQEVLRWRVADARAAGQSWQKIADALDMSRQSAWEKYREA